MEKSKIKLWKIIVSIILVLVIIFIIFTVRKAIILSSIDNKVSDYENNTKNIYIKSISTTSEYTLEMQRYIKEDVDKLIIEKKPKDGSIFKVIQIDDEHKHKVYTQKDEMKVYFESEFGGISPKPVRGSHIQAPKGVTPFASYTTLINAGYSDNILQRILSSITTKIKTVKIDEKEYYEITAGFCSNMIYDKNIQKTLIYVEKDTKLAYKMVEIVNENGEQKENITTYEYKFNEVTDENMKEPDISEYKVQN